MCMWLYVCVCTRILVALKIIQIQGRDRKLSNGENKEMNSRRR